MSNRTLGDAMQNQGPVAFTDALFQPLPPAAAEREKITRPALTYWQDAMLRLRRDKMAMTCLVVIILVTMIGIVGPWFFPKTVDGVPFQNQQNPNAIDQGPNMGDELLVVDDSFTTPDEKVDATFDTNAVMLTPDTIHAPVSVKIAGIASVNGVTVQWQPIAGVSGYQVYRTVLPPGPAETGQLSAGEIERGVAVGDVMAPQHSYTDGLGLDASEQYAYSVLSYVDDPAAGRVYSKDAAVIVTEMKKTIKLSDAQAIDPEVKPGEMLHDRAHAFGTDGLGRDVLSRMIQGTRIDMLLALVVPTICILFGLLFGAISGLMGGKVDTIFMRIVEVVDNFPDLLFFIILQVAIGKGVFSLVLAMTIFGWAGFARIVRGEVLRLREIEFVQAGRLLGAPVLRLVGKHIGPNLLGLVIIAWSGRIPNVIAFEAFLSMLGLGLEQPAPSWGNVVFDSARRMQVNPIQFFLPASVLAITLLCFYLLGNSLRDAFDPKLRGRT